MEPTESPEQLQARLRRFLASRILLLLVTLAIGLVLLTIVPAGVFEFVPLPAMLVLEAIAYGLVVWLNEPSAPVGRKLARIVLLWSGRWTAALVLGVLAFAVDAAQYGHSIGSAALTSLAATPLVGLEATLVLMLYYLWVTAPRLRHIKRAVAVALETPPAELYASLAPDPHDSLQPPATGTVGHTEYEPQEEETMPIARTPVVLAPKYFRSANEALAWAGEHLHLSAAVTLDREGEPIAVRGVAPEAVPGLAVWALEECKVTRLGTAADRAGASFRKVIVQDDRLIVLLYIDPMVWVLVGHSELADGVWLSLKPFEQACLGFLKVQYPYVSSALRG